MRNKKRTKKNNNIYGMSFKGDPKGSIGAFNSFMGEEMEDEPIKRKRRIKRKQRPLDEDGSEWFREAYLKEDKDDYSQYLFTSKEANKYAKELTKYFEDKSNPKYYDIFPESLDENNTMFIIRGNLDTVDKLHDHNYFDKETIKFFKDNGIDVIVYEPKSLIYNPDGDNIYTSVHIIQKNGPKIYSKLKSIEDIEQDDFINY